jgi:AcrR family transcriptional regulator
MSDAAAPPPGERAARQRERILDAAEACFIASGFHGASMAQIASTADISAGLIYRYFKNKSAIVKAIIDRHLESESVRVIDRLNATDDMVDELLEVFECYRARKDPKMNAALMLELTAESTRDPKLMQIVRSKDRVVGTSLRNMIRRSAAAQGVRLSASAARMRAVLLQCLVEGLIMRSIRDPALRRTALRPSIKLLVVALLS